MEPVDVYQVKLELEFSKENLLHAILKNRENTDTYMVAQAIKEFVRNQERYDSEKKRVLDMISNTT